jgi:hypothetical protein
MTLATATPTASSVPKADGSGKIAEGWLPTGVAVPTGGTTGQVLAKTSGTDRAVGWVAAAAIPTGGTTGQLLSKASNADGDVTWSAAGAVDLSAPGPIGGTTPAAVTATTVTANTSVATDVVAEKTATTGVAVDGVLLKDGGVTARPAATQDAIVVAGRDGGTSGYAVTVTPNALTANRSQTMQDIAGELAIKAMHCRTLIATVPNTAHTGTTAETTKLTYVLPRAQAPVGSMFVANVMYDAAANNANVKSVRLRCNAGATPVFFEDLTSTKSIHKFHVFGIESTTLLRWWNNGSDTGTGKSSASAESLVIGATDDLTFTFTVELADGSDTVNIRYILLQLHVPQP